LAEVERLVEISLPIFPSTIVIAPLLISFNELEVKILYSK
jgi:hypothetical protein